MTPREEQERFRDIQERIARIKFSESMLVEAEKEGHWEVAKTALDSILYDLIVIGEAVKTLRGELKGRYPRIPWKEIAGMRDILAHEYFRVSSELVRATIDIPLADLGEACSTELAR